jgi:hypothetical protein
MLRVLVYIGLLIGLAGLTGCVGPAEPKWAPDAEVARASYVFDGPPALTLFTVVNNKTGFGAHTGLLINGSQRVIFDPAGTWYHPQLPERNDVHYGMSPEIVDFYIDYHTRITYRTIVQRIEVTPEIAEQVMKAAMAYGAVPKGQCALSVTTILSKIPGFESIGVTWFPNKLSRKFGELPGVTTNVVYDTDPDDNSGVIEAPPALYVQQGR